VFNLCLGLAFAVCARERVRAEGAFAAPVFTLVVIFVCVVLTPMTLYLYLAHPAWTWMYMVDPAKVSAVAVLPLVVLHGGALIFGWLVGVRLIRMQKERIALISLVLCSITVLICVVATWGRIGNYGSYREFVGGRALAIMEVKLGYVLVAMVIGVFVAALYVVLELLRDSRRVRSR